MPDGPIRRIGVPALERGSAWDPSEAPDDIACPLCGRLLGVGGMKGWLIRRLRDHFRACRPRHAVMRRRPPHLRHDPAGCEA